MHPYLNLSNGLPAQEQNLFVSPSKHYYQTKDGRIRWQKTVLDPRTCGNKRLLTRMVLLDVHSRTVYGEFHEADSPADLASFLARAWAKKEHHPMHGLPTLLNVQKQVFADEVMRDDVALISESLGVQIGELAGGFESGIRCLKSLEDALLRLEHTWRRNCPNERDFTLTVVQELSDLLSCYASAESSVFFRDAWKQVPDAPPELFKLVDSLYEEPGVWRDFPFTRIFEQ